MISQTKGSHVTEIYDIIVIGSGIGGLAFASLMAQLSHKRVLVLERHFKLGGYTHTFDRKGYRWDGGVHYVGKMAKHEDCRQLFDLITHRPLWRHNSHAITWTENFDLSN